jgi:hypothetical protein
VGDCVDKGISSLEDFPKAKRGKEFSAVGIMKLFKCGDFYEEV